MCQAAVAGAAGFIGGQLTERLLNGGCTAYAVNLRTGRLAKTAHLHEDPWLHFFANAICTPGTLDPIVLGFDAKRQWFEGLGAWDCVGLPAGACEG